MDQRATNTVVRLGFNPMIAGSTLTRGLHRTNLNNLFTHTYLTTHNQI